MSYMQKFKAHLDSDKTITPSDDNKELTAKTNESEKIVHLAERINSWHKTLPLPERWHPLQLGRIAAQFGVSRELAAIALGYGGWLEHRVGTTSLWKKAQ